jgi:hypothetical protein
VKPVSIKAPSLAQQNAQVDDNVARAHLEQRRRETAHHARALKLREALGARRRSRGITILHGARRRPGVAKPDLPPATRACGHARRGAKPRFAGSEAAAESAGEQVGESNSRQ